LATEPVNSRSRSWDSYPLEALLVFELEIIMDQKEKSISILHPYLSMALFSPSALI
jgi:hypothetical protein